MPISGGRHPSLLDTSAYSHLRAGHPGVLDAVAKAPSIILPTVVLGELYAGFRLGSREAENRQVLHEFLEEPFVQILPVTEAVARGYGDLFARLRHAGTPIPTNDLWIAACALAATASLLTFDAHFERIGGLDLTLLR